MYKVKYSFFESPKGVNEFMRACDLFKEGEGAGLEKTITLKTTTKPDKEYIEKMRKAIEDMPEKLNMNVEYIGVKFIEAVEVL